MSRPEQAPGRGPAEPRRSWAESGGGPIGPGGPGGPGGPVGHGYSGGPVGHGGPGRPVGHGYPGGPVGPGRPVGLPPQRPEPAPGRALRRTGTTLLVVSPVLVLLAGVVWALPRIPFLLGAGGNVAAYEEEFGGAMAVADLLSVCGLALAALMLAAGIVTLRIGRAQRRRAGLSAR
ncbi:hypothetical protein USB125703_01475 [Pseudoclavibacter triregionum]|nr:hypothetical protein USB125703_01475 [Pseudoclavibacter triregionum]